MKTVNKNIRTAYIAVSLLLIMISIGVTGFSVMGFTFTEAFFMTIITIATVGFKEVHELDQTGMWFTSLLIIFSFGIFAYAATTFGRYLIDGVFTNYYRDNKLKRKIDKLKDHVVVCGYGRNGKQVVVELLDHEAQIIVLEKDPTLIAALQESGLLFIEGDATMEDVLTAANLKDAKALITTLPVDADNLFVVLSAREINTKMTIISRASMDHSDTKLKRAGADNVIMPDKIGGQRMAKLVVQPDIVEFLEYIMIQSKENVVLEEINCKKLANCFDGKSIRDLDIRNVSGANIVGLKREDNSFVINPPPELVLTSKDQIFALGTKSQMKNLIRIISGA